MPAGCFAKPANLLSAFTAVSAVVAGVAACLSVAASVVLMFSNTE
mgnify:CR=1 FL=1